MGSQRNVSIEMLRVFAMFGIVFMHCVLYAYGGHNGVGTGLHGYLAQFVNVIFSVSVNILVLISGYFTIGSMSGRFLKLRKLSKLYVSMAFYVALFLIIAIITGKTPIHPSEYLPLKSNVYWFMTVYFQLMLIAPFIVRLVDTLNKTWYRLLLVVLFITTVVIQIYGTEAGYSLLWFVFLFLFAGYLKIYEISVPGRLGVLVYIVSLWGYFVLYTLRIPFLNWLFQIGYSNIFEFLMSVCILLWFCDIKEPGKGGAIIAKAAPCTLGVYLIHENPIVRDWLWARVGEWFPIPNVFYMILISLVVFCACAIVERGRQMLFKYIRIDRLIDTVCDKLKSVGAKVINARAKN